MSLFLAGDFADPNNTIDYSVMNDLVKKDDVLLFNLEGPVLEKNKRIPHNKNKYNLYSSPEFINNFDNIKFNLSLANNHINDFRHGLENTCRFLAEKKIKYFGIHNKYYLEFNLKEEKFVIFSFNSKLTLPHSNNNINTISPSVIKLVHDYKKENENTTVIVYAHFGLELNHFPVPADREWSRSMIDAGANYIVAHHPHVIQGVEKYKSGLIIYSIGNFVLPQAFFLDKKLHYNDPRVNSGLIVEFKNSKEIIFHSISLNENQDRLLYNGVVKPSLLEKLFNFTGNNTDYIKFYKKNNSTSLYYPIFESYNDGFFRIKYFYVLFTQKFRKFLIKLKLYNPYVKSGT